MRLTFNHEISSKEDFIPKSLVDLILNSRQIKNPKEFLNPISPLKISLTDFNQKYQLQLDKVVKLLEKIKKNDQMIVVYTDYDADGVTGGAILWETLYLLGFKVMPYVPDRKKEGYGFSITGIDNVINQFNPALIISVDHGITKVKEIAYANKRGVRIIVTDHHLKSDTAPEAEAIFHIPALSGSGVAYFFAKEIFKNLKFKISNFKLLENNFQTDYLALASIGTIADLVPLIGPSRSVVKFGLDAFPKVKRYGIRHILIQAGIEGKKITPYEVGFIIAPRINAVGRLHLAIDALRLLCTTDEKKAERLAKSIGETNAKRQDLVEKSVNEAKSMIAKTPAIIKNKLIILVSENWHEGIIGLIASKLVEQFYRPTIVLTKTDGHYKASARSIPAFNITSFLKDLKELLIDVGGHAAAAGFTIEESMLKNFMTVAQKKANSQIRDEDLEEVIHADIKLPLSMLNLSYALELEKLEPYGIGNQKPIFLSDVELMSASYLGRSLKHLKLIFKDLKSDRSVEFIAFNMGEKFNMLSRGQKYQIAYNLEIDRWGGGAEKLKGRLIAQL